VFAVVGVAIPVAALDAVLTNAFPTMCDGRLFLCWMIDERGYVLHARDPRCMGASAAAASCVGSSFATVRPLIASVLVSSGFFQEIAVSGSSSVMYSLYRNRSNARKTVQLVATHDGTSMSAEQQLEVNMFAVTATSATAIVLSGAGMQVSSNVCMCRSSRLRLFSQISPSPCLMSRDPVFSVGYVLPSLRALDCACAAC
jgi:hypothetical protein